MTTPRSAEYELRKTFTGKYYIRFHCPHCRAVLKADREDLGSALACPECTGALTVPGTREEFDARTGGEDREPEVPKAVEGQDAETPPAAVEPGRARRVHGGLGSMSEVPAAEVTHHVSDLLLEGEIVERAFKLVRELFVFTNRRLILIDPQGLAVRKVEFHSIPYRSISHFSVETAGVREVDCELKLFLSGLRQPIDRKVKYGGGVLEVQRLLAEHVLG